MNNNRREVTPDALQEIIRHAYETTLTPDETRIRLIRHRLMADQLSKQCAQPKRTGRFSIWVFGFAFVAFGAAASWWIGDILWPAHPVAVNEQVTDESNQQRHTASETEQQVDKKGGSISSQDNIGGSNRATDENVIYRHEPL